MPVASLDPRRLQNSACSLICGLHFMVKTVSPPLYTVLCCGLCSCVADGRNCDENICDGGVALVTVSEMSNADVVVIVIIIVI